MKNQKLKWVLLGLGILLLVSGGISAYFYLNSSKYIFEKAITKATDTLTANEKEKEISFDTIHWQTNTKVSEVNEGVTTSNQFDGTLGFDLDKQKMNLNLIYLLNEAKVLDLDAFFEKNRFYFKLKDIMEEFYYVESDEDVFASLSAQEDIDYSYIVKYTRGVILSSLANKDFKKESSEIEVDNTKSKTTKITLKLTEEKVYDIYVNFFSKLKTDKKMLGEVKKVSKDFDTKDINTIIEEFKGEKKDADNDNYISYVIYVDGKKNIIRQEITTNESDTAIRIDTQQDKDKKNYRAISVMNNKQEVVSLILKDKNEKEADITLQSAFVSAKGTLEYSDKLFDLKLTINDFLGNKVGDVSCYLKEENEKEYTVNVQFSYSDGTNQVQFDSQNKMILDKALEEFDTTGSKNVDTLTEEEQANFYLKLQEYFSKTLGTDMLENMI